MEISVAEQRILLLLQECQALRRGHFVLKSGLHSDLFVEKERILLRTNEVFRLTDAMAIELVEVRKVEFDVVLGAPGNSGSRLALALAYAYGRRRARDIPNLDAHTTVVERNDGTASVPKIRREVEITVRPAVATALRNQRVLLVEDVCTFGGTLSSLALVAARYGGDPIVATSLVDRGGLALLKTVRHRFAPRPIPHRFALTRIANNLWHAPNEPIEGYRPCPLCEEQIPINTELGHGAEYLRRRAARS